jgi:ribosomal protein S18 acetylase RimI-like enzyme
MSTDLRVEPLDAARGDALQCAQMMAASEPWITLKRTVEFLLPLMTDSVGEVHVMRDETGVAAFVMLDLRGLLNGYVRSICVRPDRRNQGLGAAILTWAEQRIFRQSPNVFLCTSSFNPGAQRFYARQGYQLVGPLKNLIVEGHDEILLRKTIGTLSDFKKAQS